MKTLKFNNSTYKALSNICNAIAQVLFGGFIAGVIILPVEGWKVFVLISELIFSFGFWYLSIIFAERGKL